MVRSEIDSLEVARRFCVDHRNVTKAIRKLISDDENCESMFSELEYVSKQNKKLPMFVMTFDGFSMLSDTWRFSRGEWASVKAAIISEFGKECVVLSSVRTRFEDDFYHMLSGVLWNKKVIRQYPYAGFFVDFYIPDFFLFVEFDEDHHFSKAAKERDLDRWASITEKYIDQFDEKPSIIRVKKGEELEGIGRIVGWIALNSLGAIGVTSLYCEKE